MPKSTALANELLLLFFNNSNMALIGDATGLRGSSTVGSLYIALHTADPGIGGTQATSEANFTGYARVAVARSGAGWTVAGNSVSNAADILFAMCTAGSNAITHFSIGPSSSGASKISYSGALSPTITVTNGITYSIPAGTAIVTES